MAHAVKFLFRILNSIISLFSLLVIWAMRMAPILYKSRTIEEMTKTRMQEWINMLQMIPSNRLSRQIWGRSFVRNPSLVSMTQDFPSFNGWAKLTRLLASRPHPFAARTPNLPSSRRAAVCRVRDGIGCCQHAYTRSRGCFVGGSEATLAQS